MTMILVGMYRSGALTKFTSLGLIGELVLLRASVEAMIAELFIMLVLGLLLRCTNCYLRGG